MSERRKIWNEEIVRKILLSVNVSVLQKQAGPTVTVVSEGRSSE